jgi:glycosyltransferase involved in cell wall biosynthesis
MMKPRLLFLQDKFTTYGGGNAVAAWMLQALCDEYNVTLLTRDPVDLPAINNFYGTALRSSDLSVMTPPTLVRALVRLDPDPRSVQPIAYMYRMCQDMQADYDYFVCGHGEADFGVPGIQYIHYPYFKQHYRLPLTTLEKSGWGQVRQLVRGELRPWRVISRFSWERIFQNLTLVNSDWTGGVVRDAYGIDPITVYPPVLDSFAPVEWEQREVGFVALGRIVPEKGLHDVIAILELVRQEYPEVHLHIIGTSAVFTPIEREYYTTIRELIAKNKAWVTLHEDVPRSELEALVVQHRYGIHGQNFEHFGIAIGEMVAAGCIVFVRANGGQMEIVDRDPRLMYTSFEDAATKIIRVLRSPEEQVSLRHMLQTRRSLFSAESFMATIRRLVAEFPQSGRATVNGAN